MEIKDATDQAELIRKVKRVGNALLEITSNDFDKLKELAEKQINSEDVDVIRMGKCNLTTIYQYRSLRDKTKIQREFAEAYRKKLFSNSNDT